MVSARCGATEETQKQLGDSLRLLLLHPMTGPLHEIAAVKMGGGPRAHALQRTGGLKRTPIATSRYKKCRHFDLSSRKAPKVECEAPVHAAPIALQRPLKPVRAYSVA